jgi:hypothetical protein
MNGSIDCAWGFELSCPVTLEIDGYELAVNAILWQRNSATPDIVWWSSLFQHPVHAKKFPNVVLSLDKHEIRTSSVAKAIDWLTACHTGSSEQKFIRHD